MTNCEHIWLLGPSRFRCSKCNRYLTPHHIWLWHRARTRYWAWRGRLSRAIFHP